MPRDYTGDLIDLGNSENPIPPTSALNDHLAAVFVGFDVDPKVAIEPAPFDNLGISLAAEQLRRHSLESPPRATLYVSKIIYVVKQTLPPTEAFSCQQQDRA